MLARCARGRSGSRFRGFDGRHVFWSSRRTLLGRLPVLRRMARHLNRSRHRIRSWRFQGLAARHRAGRGSGPERSPVLFARTSSGGSGSALVRGQVCGRANSITSAARSLAAAAPRVLASATSCRRACRAVVVQHAPQARAVIGEAVVTSSLGVLPPTPSWGTMSQRGPGPSVGCTAS